MNFVFIAYFLFNLPNAFDKLNEGVENEISNKIFCDIGCSRACDR